MFSFLKTKESSTAVIDKKTVQTQTIEEIHESFFTEVDKLLAFAKISHSVETQQEGLLEKSRRLKSLGFSNSKEVQDAQIEIDRLDVLKDINRTKAKLREAIDYFSMRYPQYKFITIQSIQKICKKYNLVYGNVNKYKGTVPEKNLKQMENLSIYPEDETWIEETHYFNLYRMDPTFKIIPYEVPVREFGMTSKDLDNWRQVLAPQQQLRSINSGGIDIKKYPQTLLIAAPVKDFDMSESEIKDFQLSPKAIEVPDPIVLKSVLYKGDQYYLVVTAWGLEAEEEDIVNQKMN